MLYICIFNVNLWNMGMNFIQRENGGSLRAVLIGSIFTDIHHVFAFVYTSKTNLF